MITVSYYRNVRRLNRKYKGKITFKTQFAFD